MFTVYSDMFRLTQVIFRLELYLFAMSLCSFWDPRRLQAFYMDVICCITTGGSNKCHCYGIGIMTFVTTPNGNTVDNIYVKNM